MSIIKTIKHYEMFEKHPKNSTYFEYFQRVNNSYIVIYESGVKKYFNDKIGLPKRAKAIIKNVSCGRIVKETSGTKAKYIIRVTEFTNYKK